MNETKKLENKERAKAILSLLSMIALGVKFMFHIDVPENILDIAVNVILGIGTLWAWFRNNYITKRGIKQLHVLKNGKLQ